MGSARARERFAYVRRSGGAPSLGVHKVRVNFLILWTACSDWWIP
jgi:hypothetical protein